MKRPHSDALIYWDMATNMALHGTVSLGYNARGYVVRNRDGVYYAKYGLGWPAVLVPAAALYRIVDTQELDMGVKESYERLIFTLTPALAGAGTVVLLFLVLVMLGMGRKTAVFFALSGIFATPLLVYGRDLYRESFQAFLFTLFLWSCVSMEQKHRLYYAAIIGLTIGLAMLTKMTNGALLIAGLAWIYVVYRGRAWRPALIMLLSVVPFVTVLLWYNILRFGSILPDSYGFYVVPQGFFTPWYYGIFGDLLSPGRGLLWYMPMVALLPRGLDVLRKKAGIRYAVLIGGTFLFYLFLYASWSPWHGAEQWGPRFLAPLMGMLMVPIAFSVYSIRHKKLILGALGLLGLMVNIPGVVIHYYDYYAQVPYTPYNSVPIGLDGKPTRQMPMDNLYMTAFVPSFSPILGHLWLLKHAITRDPDLSRDPPWKWMRYKPFNRRIKNGLVQPNLWFCIHRTRFGHLLSLVMTVFFLFLATLSLWEIKKDLA